MERDLDPAMPFAFFPQHEAEMLAAMRTIKRMAGISHFMIIAPDKTIRRTGFPEDGLFEQIGMIVKRVKDALADDGIRISWWNCSTLKVGPGAPYTPIKGLGNGTSAFSYCPLDSGFRQKFVGRCRRIAEIAKPHMILFEDDYEFSNHGAVGYGCFCDHHLAEFERRAGCRYEREELERIFRAVTPESMRLRQRYADMMRDTLTDLAAETSSAVQSVSPATRLGLCQPGCWAIDGDMTEPVARAFAGRLRPFVRICGASYGEDHPAFMPANLYTTLYTAQRLPADIDRYYEADTFPHSRFFCSSAMLESMCTLALSYGCIDLQLYASHQLPDPLIERGYLEMYRDTRARFQALRKEIGESEVSGIELVSRANAGIACAWNGSSFRDSGLGGGYLGSRLFSRLGFPYTSRNGAVRALIGDATPRLLSDEELLGLLAGPLFIDGAALRVLAERGYAELLGVELIEGGMHDFNVEVVNDVALFRDKAGQAIYSMAYLNFGVERADIVATRALSGTEVMTDYARLVATEPEPMRRRHGLLRCVNRLGGRIVVLPSTLDTVASNLYGYQKRELLRRLFRWLSPESMPAAVLDQPNISLTANVARRGRKLVLTLINLCSDAARNITLDVAPAFVAMPVEILDGSEWRRASHSWNATTLEVHETLPLLKPQILRLIPATDAGRFDGEV